MSSVPPAQPRPPLGPRGGPRLYPVPVHSNRPKAGRRRALHQPNGQHPYQVSTRENSVFLGRHMRDQDTSIVRIDINRISPRVTRRVQNPRFTAFREPTGCALIQLAALLTIQPATMEPHEALAALSYASGRSSSSCGEPCFGQRVAR